MYYTNIIFTYPKQNFKSYHSLVYFSLSKNLFISSNDKERPLFKLYNRKNKNHLVIISRMQPDAEYLKSFLRIESYKCISYETIIDKLKNGDTVPFMLSTIPCTKTKGKLKGITNIKDQDIWLCKKASQWGFYVDYFTSHPVQNEGKDGYILYGVSYKGYLQIKDISLFKKSLLDGVGVHKAWGFGLLDITNSNQT